MIRGGSFGGSSIGTGRGPEPGLVINGAPTNDRITARRDPRLVITPRNGSDASGAPGVLGAPERGLGGADPRIGVRGFDGLTGSRATRNGDGFAPPPAPMPIVDPPPTPVPAEPDGAVVVAGAVTYDYDNLDCDWNEVCADWADGWHHGYHHGYRDGWHDGWHDGWWHGGWGWWGWPSSWFSWCGDDWRFSIGIGWGWNWGWRWGWSDPWWCGWGWSDPYWSWHPHRVRVHYRPAYVHRFRWYEVAVPVETTWVSLHDAWALEPLACDDPIEPWAAPASSACLAIVASDTDAIDAPLVPASADALEEAYVTLRDGDVVAADLAFAALVRREPMNLDARFGLFVTRWLWLDAEGATTALRTILRADPAWVLNVPREDLLDLQYRRLRDDLHRRAADGSPEALLGAAAIDAALGDLLSAYYHADRAAGTRYDEEAANLKAVVSRGLGGAN